MDSWLDSARQRIATRTGIGEDQLGLAENDVESLLELARVAAHDSGDRTNAPLVCFLVGLAVGRDPDLELAALAAHAQRDAAT